MSRSLLGGLLSYPGPPKLVHEIPLETMWGGKPGSVYPEYLKQPPTPPAPAPSSPDGHDRKKKGGLLGGLGQLFDFWAD